MIIYTIWSLSFSLHFDLDLVLVWNLIDLLDTISGAENIETSWTCDAKFWRFYLNQHFVWTWNKNKRKIKSPIFFWKFIVFLEIFVPSEESFNQSQLSSQSHQSFLLSLKSLRIVDFDFIKYFWLDFTFIHFLFWWFNSLESSIIFLLEDICCNHHIDSIIDSSFCIFDKIAIVLELNQLVGVLWFQMFNDSIRELWKIIVNDF